MSVLDKLAPGSRVAVIRLRSLGDCVLSTPAVHLLKKHRPDLEIAVVAEERFADVYRDNPDIAAVLPPRVRELRAFSPKLCLNLHGGTRSARLTALSGAEFRAGFDIFTPGVIYNVRIPRAQETMGVTRRVHTAEHAASAAFHLGVPPGDVPRARVTAPAGRLIDGNYAVIHPVAATREKTWPAEKFAAVADGLGDLQPVFIAGAQDNLQPFARWRTFAGAPLQDVARLMRDASLFIGNDSGPAHIGAAFGVPEVVLFGPSDAEIWAPWRTASQVLQAQPIGDIPVAAVLEAARVLRGVAA